MAMLEKLQLLSLNLRWSCREPPARGAFRSATPLLFTMRTTARSPNVNLCPFGKNKKIGFNAKGRSVSVDRTVG